MNTVFNRAIYRAFNQDLKVADASETIKVALFRDTSTYTPNPDHDTVNDILSNGGVRISVTSYADATFGSKALTLDDTNNRTKWSGSNVSFGTLESGQTVAAALFYEFLTNDTDSIPIVWFDGKISVKSFSPVALSATGSITGATQANPCVITSTAHGLSNGDKVYISGVGGMTQLNGNVCTVAGAAANTFQLSGVNSSAYGAYTSGGTWSKVMTVYCGYLKEALAAGAALDFGGGATCNVATAASAGAASIEVRSLAAAIDAGDVANDVQTTLNLPAALGGGTFTLNVPTDGIFSIKPLSETL